MSEPSASPPPEPAGGALVRKKVWDVPVRLVHWALPVLIAVSWWSAEVSKDINAMSWHMLCGEIVLGLVIFRAYWGVFGSETARFGHFVRGPRAIIAHVRGQKIDRLGHNPLGAVSVVVMLLLLAAQLVLGLFGIDEYELTAGPLQPFIPGELAHKATALHGKVFWVLIAVIAAHIVAIGIYRLRGRNLLGPMITGHTRTQGDTDDVEFAPLWRLALGVVIALGLTYAIAKGFKF